MFNKEPYHAPNITTYSSQMCLQYIVFAIPINDSLTLF